MSTSALSLTKMLSANQQLVQPQPIYLQLTQGHEGLDGNQQNCQFPLEIPVLNLYCRW
jgi:hypothetical protein